MQTAVYDVVGLLGSFMIAASLLPQIWKVFRTKSATDISFVFMGLYVSGLTMLTVYGVAEALWPIYIPCAIELAGAVLLLVLKCVYTLRPASHTSTAAFDALVTE